MQHFSLTFQGNKKDFAVLCTQNRTYDIREAGTSNSCLLIPKLNLFEQTKVNTDRIIKYYNVCGIFHTYYEVKKFQNKQIFIKLFVNKCLKYFRQKNVNLNGKNYLIYLNPHLLKEWNMNHQ